MIKDISIYESGDGGDINLINDDIELSHTLFNQVYLALFGGNIQQSTGEQDTNLEERLDWWGNILMQKDSQFNSLTERQLLTTVVNGNSLQNLESVVERDLEFLAEYANVNVDVEMEDYNRISINIQVIEPNQREQKMRFLWEGVENQFTQEIVVGEIRTRPTLWILHGGFWDDRGIWIDREKWYDTHDDANP